LSDLSRLRARLVRLERRGKALKRELEELRSLRLVEPGPLTRTEERRMLRLDAEIIQARGDWLQIRDRLAAEERRLIQEPAGFLRFT
jgi:hypothetical protein